jgi:hypothetical protein
MKEREREREREREQTWGQLLHISKSIMLHGGCIFSIEKPGQNIISGVSIIDLSTILT